MEEDKGDNVNNHINSSITKIIELIKYSYLNINTEFHDSSLVQLIELEKNEEEFFFIMLTLLSEYNNYVNNFEKEIAIYLKNYFKRVEDKAFIKNMSNKFILEKGLMFVKSFLEENSKISCLSSYFEDVIDSIFTIAKHTNIIKEFSETVLIKLIKEPLNNYNGQINLNELIRLLFVLEVAFKSYLNNLLNIGNDFDELFGFYNFIFSKIEGKIKDKIQLSKNSLNNNEYSYFNTLEQSSLLIYHLISSFIKISLFCLDYCCKNIFFQIQFESFSYDIDNNNKSNIDKVFFESEQFLMFIFKALMFAYNISTDSIDSDNFILIIIINDENKGYKKYFNIFNIKLTKIKGTLFELMGEIIKKISTFEIFDKLVKFKEFIYKITNLAIDHLVDIYSHKNYPQDYPCDDRVQMGNYLASTKLFSYIEKLVSYNILSEIFDKRKYEIIKVIIIKNLKLNEIEKLCFNDQTSDEYVRSIFDLYHLCQENTLKKKNLKILTNLCQNDTSLLDCMINISLNVLLYCTLNQNNKLIQKDEEIIFSYVISSFSKVELMELSLLLLTSLSFLISDKPQIHQKVKHVTTQTNNILIRLNDPLLKTKLCMFYAYNLDYLFDLKIEFQLFEQCLQFIFECTIQNDQNIHLFQIGFNTINSVIFLNHIQPYCYGIVSKYITKLISFIQTSKMKTYEDDFNSFIKGVIQMYLQNKSKNSDNDSILLFEMFWSFFNDKLTPYLRNEDQSFSKNNFDRRQPLRAKPDCSEIINDCQLLKTFLISLKNKPALNIDIKRTIYQQIITTLMPFIGNFLNLDFEEDILELLIIVFNCVKQFNEIDVNYLKDYLIKMNSGDDGIFNHKFEEYHVNFLFTLVQCFDKKLLVQKQIMFLLFDNIECRLSSFEKKSQVHKILAEHIIYSDFAFTYLIHFYPQITEENEIINTLNVFLTRIKTNPNSNNELIQKLCICITLLLMKFNSLKVLNQIDLSVFIKKMLQVYPNKYADKVEHEIIGIGFNIINRYLSMTEDQMLQKFVKGNFEELVYIKQNSIYKNKQMVKKENKENKENEEVEEECKNKFKFSKRISHFNDKRFDKINCSLTILDNLNEESFSKSDNNENDVDLNSEEAIDDEHNKENNIQYNKQYEYVNENEMNENSYSDSDDTEMKDDESKTEKNNYKGNKIEKYYMKFADSELVQFINSVNQFKLFDSFLKELENEKPLLYSNIMSTIFTESRIKVLNKFRLLQKVPIINKTSDSENTNNLNYYTYRKILKIKSRNNFDV